MHDIPKENMRDNIIKFADQEFKTLIGEYGEVEGLLIIKKILDLELQSLSVTQQTSVNNLHQAYFRPNNLFANLPPLETSSWSRPYARAILELQLLKRMQEMAERKPLGLDWVLKWTKQKAKTIEFQVIQQGQSPVSVVPQSIMLAFGFLLLYFYGDEKAQKVLPYVAFLFCFRIACEKLCNYIDYRYTLFTQKWTNEWGYGEAYKQVKGAIEEIQNKEFIIAHTHQESGQEIFNSGLGNAN